MAKHLNIILTEADVAEAARCIVNSPMTPVDMTVEAFLNRAARKAVAAIMHKRQPYDLAKFEPPGLGYQHDTHWLTDGVNRPLYGNNN